MVHSFSQVDNANGNTTIIFFEDSKKRQVILTKGTDAQADYQIILSALPDDTDVRTALNLMRNHYYFRANPNNPSIFRPFPKSNVEKSFNSIMRTYNSAHNTI